MPNPSDPPVSEYMTATPATVSAELTIADALDRMFSDNVRHLPVLDEAGRLVGLISTRDIALATALRGIDPDRATVADAMSSAPYACEESTPLSQVALEMEKHRLGSAIVTRGGVPTGMFTTTDAMRALRSLIAGAPVEPAVHPTHVVEHEEPDHPVRHPRTHARQPSPMAGTLSWLLGWR